MSLLGWTLPQSATGRAALLPPPPWHYSGDVIGVDFRTDPVRVAELLPPGMDPAGDGSGSFVFADWCSAADRDPRILADPARGQYREAYVVLHGTFRGRRAGRVPYIWVDNDLSLVRGLVQGFPKKLGEIAMTRPVTLGKGGVRRAVGSRFAAHVSALGRRLCTLAVDLAEERETGYLPKGVATPLLHTRLWPGIEEGPPAVHELSRARVTDFVLGPVFTGPATLEFAASEFEELDRLAPTAVGPGYSCAVAFSVVGGETIPLTGAAEEADPSGGGA